MSANLTMPLYYYDDHGYKIGPINKKELYALVENGTIRPETRLTDGKIETQAKNIPKLKFYAPEYHRAEEIFNLENINFDNLPPVIDSPKTPQPIRQEETIEIQKNILQPVKPILQNESALPRHTKYWYSRIALRTFYTIATIIFYAGLIFTILASLICSIITLQVQPVMFVILTPIVLLGGTICTLAWTIFFGLKADKIQWQINIEEHLIEVKNRLKQND